MTLNARMLGCVMLCTWFCVLLWIRQNGPDLTYVKAPLEASKAILPLLAFFTLAFWLLFR